MHFRPQIQYAIFDRSLNKKLFCNCCKTRETKKGLRPRQIKTCFIGAFWQSIATLMRIFAFLQHFVAGKYETSIKCLDSQFTGYSGVYWWPFCSLSENVDHSIDWVYIYNCICICSYAVIKLFFMNIYFLSRTTPYISSPMSMVKNGKLDKQLQTNKKTTPKVGHL